MCGRAAQTESAIHAAQAIFHRYTTTNATITDESSTSNAKSNNFTSINTTWSNENVTVSIDNHDSDSNIHIHDDETTKQHDYQHNFNLSPGMQSVIFIRDPTCRIHDNFNHNNHNTTTNNNNNNNNNNNTPKICSTRKVWGLIPISGTLTSPIQPSDHYSNLMFNARSDTLYDKKTFRDLASKGNTCVCVFDGFYEWKEHDKDILSTKSGKQPYYVYKSNNTPLFIAGLWTSAYTGRQTTIIKNNDETTTKQSNHETIDTFTIITMDACSNLRWLHHRQPLFIWDEKLAVEWLLHPCKAVLDRMVTSANLNQTIVNNGDSTSGIFSNDHRQPQNKQLGCNLLQWHPVTKLMSNSNYNTIDCIKPIHISKAPSVKSFFKTKSNIDNKTTITTQSPSNSEKKEQNELHFEKQNNATSTTKVSSNLKRTFSLEHENHDMESTTITTSNAQKKIKTFFLNTDNNDTSLGKSHVQTIRPKNKSINLVMKSNATPKKGSITSYFTSKNAPT